jgi:hypothetical protein
MQTQPAHHRSRSAAYHAGADGSRFGVHLSVPLGRVLDGPLDRDTRTDPLTGLTEQLNRPDTGPGRAATDPVHWVSPWGEHTIGGRL